jgi:hypothetical protein
VNEVRDYAARKDQFFLITRAGLLPEILRELSGRRVTVLVSEPQEGKQKRFDRLLLLRTIGD